MKFHSDEESCCRKLRQTTGYVVDADLTPEARKLSGTCQIRQFLELLVSNSVSTTPVKHVSVSH